MGPILKGKRIISITYNQLHWRKRKWILFRMMQMYFWETVKKCPEIYTEVKDLTFTVRKFREYLKQYERIYLLKYKRVSPTFQVGGRFTRKTSVVLSDIQGPDSVCLVTVALWIDKKFDTQLDFNKEKNYSDWRKLKDKEKEEMESLKDLQVCYLVLLTNGIKYVIILGL